MTGLGQRKPSNDAIPPLKNDILYIALTCLFFFISVLQYGPIISYRAGDFPYFMMSMRTDFKGIAISSKATITLPIPV